ncbi:MAG TPA: LLM class flavin-dependent oxidoreductase [Solirubrobacteraceae bacterium]|jgi:probable F420-dependent oxidoreductase|nr:LLM class flavin-dependent oxidoreductase [Solirubrobacteraceae bacterium]
MPELRWGLTLPFAGVALAEHGDLVRRAEAAGYQDLWSGETNGPDGFTPLVLAASCTQRLRLGTGVVNPFTRGLAVLAQHAAALQDASRGRFCLGLGSSSDVIVERWNGVPFERPLSRVREAVTALRPILAGERGPGGFRLEQPPAEPVPIFVAALRDRMLALGGELGDGTFVNFLPISAVGHVCEQIRLGEARAGHEPGSTEVACRFFCIPEPPEVGAQMARFMFAAYATVPVYERFFRSLGWGERIDPMVEAWRGGDRKAAAERAPEDLIAEIFIFGDPQRQRARLDEFAAAGITTFVLTPIAPAERLAELIDALAR